MLRSTTREGRARPTGEDRERLLEILRSNQGFSDPEKWLEYAWQHNFTKTRAEKLTCCPDCGAQAHVTIGQYVYYSTLARLKMCTHCGLVYSDARIDTEVIRMHFERSYKDENYFQQQRRPIFDQIASLVDRFTPPGGRALDIGGAMGHLMGAAKRIRPDLDITICDISESACAAATATYGFQTICGTVTALEKVQAPFHVVVMSDVIYYEPNLASLWRLLPDLVAHGGVAIIRVPNKLTLIRFSQYISRLLEPRRVREMAARIRFFNPEHLFVFSRRYLTKQLRGIGFDPVVVMPSESLLGNAKWRYPRSLWYGMARAVHFCSFGRFIITPSLLVLGIRPRQPSAPPFDPTIEVSNG